MIMGMNYSKAVEGVDDVLGDAAKATAADFGETVGAAGDRIGAATQRVEGRVEDISGSAREALDSMQRIVTDFAKRTGQRAGDVADVAKTAGADAVKQFGALARDFGRGGLDNVAGAVARRPVAALAIAAGVGLMLGLASRSVSRR
jgi:ElaB/YqjD/DUF883 family membrane-anchored ribosome-binding protein